MEEHLPSEHDQLNESPSLRSGYLRDYGIILVVGGIFFLGRRKVVVCPICEHTLARASDWCVACGAYLGLLRREPHRIAYRVAGSIALGVTVLAAIAWQVFYPLLQGQAIPHRVPWIGWGIAVGSAFLALGLTAHQHLDRAVRRMFGDN